MSGAEIDGLEIQTTRWPRDDARQHARELGATRRLMASARDSLTACAYAQTSQPPSIAPLVNRLPGFGPAFLWVSRGFRD
jgi:hypothetical protein